MTAGGNVEISKFRECVDWITESLIRQTLGLVVVGSI